MIHHHVSKRALRCGEGRNFKLQKINVTAKETVNHWSALSIYNFVMSRMLYKWKELTSGCQKTDGGGEHTKGKQKGALRGDGIVLDLDCGYGYVNLDTG